MKGLIMHPAVEARPLHPRVKQRLQAMLSKFPRECIKVYLRNFIVCEQGDCRIPVHTPLGTLRKELSRRSRLSSPKVIMTQGCKIIKDADTCAFLSIIDGDVIEVFEA